MTGPAANPIDAARQVAEHATRLAKLELELKLAELRGKAVRLGLGAAFGLTAALLAPLVFVFLLAAVAAALATVFSVWLAILIVAGVLVLLVAALLGAAVMLLKGAGKRDNNGK